MKTLQKIIGAALLATCASTQAVTVANESTSNVFVTTFAYEKGEQSPCEIRRLISPGQVMKFDEIKAHEIWATKKSKTNPVKLVTDLKTDEITHAVDMKDHFAKQGAEHYDRCKSAELIKVRIDTLSGSYGNYCGETGRHVQSNATLISKDAVLHVQDDKPYSTPSCKAL